MLRNEPHLAGVKLHPAQLYSALYALALFLLLLRLLPYKHFDGMLAATYGILHSFGRFGLEQLRQDNRGKLGSRWTHTNLYSAILFLVGVTLFALGPMLPNTPIDTSVRWVDVFTDVRVLRWVIPFGFFFFFFTYGVQYKRVGSWVSE